MQPSGSVLETLLHLPDPHPPSHALDPYHWTIKLQNILSMPDITANDRMLKYTRLNSLNKDFIADVTVYAKTIISEYFIEEGKSIGVREIGGCAGGKKFLWRGVLFKLAYGNMGPYTGNEEAAAKAMGHDLKGGNSYFRCGVPGLNVALQALIDYKGFRMHAQALLPIDKNTIKVGTDDGGHVIHADCEELLDKMKQAAKELNLRSHVIQGKTLHSACDVEGHVGFDGRYYIVDLCRTFPPESPSVAAHLNSCVCYMPGDVVTVPADHDGEGDNEISTTSYGHIYSRNCDGTFNIRLVGNTPASDSRQNVYTHTVRMRPEELIGSSAGLSIYWRLLRPEYVKHRGKGVLDSVLRLQKEIKWSSTQTSGVSSHSKDNPDQCHSTDFITSPPNISAPDSSPHCGREVSEKSYSMCTILQTPPNALTMTRSFSVPNSSGDSMSNTHSRSYVSAVLSRNVSAPKEVSTSEGAWQYTNEYMDEEYLPPPPSLTKRDSSSGGPTYDLMPLPDAPAFPKLNKFQMSINAENNENISMDDIGAVPQKQPSLRISESKYDSNWGQPYDEIATTPSSVLQKFADLYDTPYQSGAAFPVPALSPDALSSFSKTDPECVENNNQVHAATALLVKVVVPGLAVDLVGRGHPMEREGLSITEYMHKHGINIRHTGLLRYHVLHVELPCPQSEERKQLLGAELLQECIYRTAKNVLRRIQRMWMVSHRSSSEDGMMTLLVRYMNLISGYHDKAAEFWNTMLIPGIISRFGQCALTQWESGTQERTADMPYLYNSCCSDSDLRILVERVASSTGIVLSSECKSQLEMGPVKLFEFTVSDIVELKPVVKHMHQVDLGEGIMLSLRGQEKETQNASAGVITRLMGMAITKLHSALKAVPDDQATKRALADAYQCLAFAGWQSNACSDTREFQIYRSLLCDDSHTMCSKLGLSYRDAVIGICIVITHFSDNNKKKKERHHVRIRSAEVCLNCVSLNFYRQYLEYKKGISTVRSTVDMEIGHQSVKGIRRFFPLIVNESHAEAGFHILCAELVRADTLPDSVYQPSVPLSHTGISEGHPQGLTIYKPNPVVGLSVPEFDGRTALRVVSAVMNSMVVKFEESADQGMLSDSALVGFSRFHHTLLYLSERDQSIRQEANDRVEKFVSHRMYRHKIETPDLGRLLIYVLMSDRGWDMEFRHCYLEEILSRQVNWFVKDHINPELLILETAPVSVYRLKTTFKATLRSLRIVMFQVFFLHSIGRKHNSPADAMRSTDDLVLKLYNASLGRPTAAMHNNYRTEFESICRVSTYAQFLSRIGCVYSPSDMTKLLRNAVRACCAKNYGGLKLVDICGDNTVETIDRVESIGVKTSYRDAVVSTTSSPGNTVPSNNIVYEENLPANASWEDVEKLGTDELLSAIRADLRLKVQKRRKALNAMQKKMEHDRGHADRPLKPPSHRKNIGKKQNNSPSSNRHRGQEESMRDMNSSWRKK